MPKFYILRQPTNTRYDSLVGMNSLSHTLFERISDAETAISKIVTSHPNMDPSTLHICVEQR